MNSTWRSAAALGAMALFTAACASGATDVPVDDASAGAGTAVPTTSAARPNTPAPATTVTPSTVVDIESLETLPPAEPELIELTSDTDPSELRFETLSAFGGVRVGFDVAARLVASGDFVGVDPDPSASKYWNAPAFVALVTQGLDGTEITSVDELLARTAAVPGASVEPTFTAIDALGHRLIGYEFTQLTEGQGITPLFASARLGAPVQGAWWPFPRGEVYLADTDRGVLAVGMAGVDDDDIAAARPVFADLVLNMELAAAFDDAPAELSGFQPAELDERPLAAAPTSDFEVLEDAYRALRAGPYEITNLGEPYVIDVPSEWTVKLNVPGFVVLARSHSFGPMNAALVALRDVSFGRWGTTSPAPIGDEVDLTDMRAFVADPPAGLTIDNVAEVALGSRTALAFDLGFDEPDCSVERPCVFNLVTDWGKVEPIRAGFGIRIWWVETDDGGSITWFTSSTDPAELAAIGEVVESIEFG